MTPGPGVPPTKDAEQLTVQVTVPAVARATLVFDVLGRAGEPLNFTQLMHETGLSKSSLHNLCMSLVACGLLERDRDARFQIGLKIVELAHSRLQGTTLVDHFRAACAEELGSEGAVLAVLRGADAVYLASVSGKKPFAVRYELGLALPAAFSASGKAILSTLPERKVRDLIGAVARPRLVVSEAKSIEHLLSELEECRDRGYSIDDEEVARGMICIGAPVRARRYGEAVAGVAISTPKHQGLLDTGGLDALAAQAQRLAALIQRYGTGPV